MMLITYTPKKLLDVLKLCNVRITWLVNDGIERDYFFGKFDEIDGERVKSKNITYDYKKKITNKGIKKVAGALELYGFDPELVISCFLNDSFEPMIPKELL